MNSSEKTNASHHLAGVIVSIVLGLASLILAWLAITTHGYGVIGVAWLAVWVWLPLVALQAGISLYYLLRKQPPARIWALMWLPTVLSVLAVPLYEMLETQRYIARLARIPVHAEVHVNLTGRTMLPDVKGHGSDTPRAMVGDQPYEFLSLMRYPELDSMGESTVDTADAGGEGYAWLYTGERISTQATSMARHYPADTDSSTGRDVRVPLIAPPVYPELPAALADPIESLLQFRYYHYPDRTEVAAAIHLSFTQEIALWKHPGELVQVVVFTLAPDPVARLQINGQEIDLGQTEAPAPPGHPAHDEFCRLGGAWARLPLEGEWEVRWHGTQAPFAWHSARVRVPQFPGGTSASGRLRAERAHLTITGENTLAVERVQERDFSNDKSAIRVTGKPPANAPCSPATKLVDPAVIRILSP